MRTNHIHRVGTALQALAILSCIAILGHVSASPPLVHGSESSSIRTAPDPLSPVLAAATLAVPHELEDHVDAASVAVRPIPADQWTVYAEQALTEMVLIESSSGRDGAAIAWTMARRWHAFAEPGGQGFAEYVIETSRPLRRFYAVLYALEDGESLTPAEIVERAGLTVHQENVFSGDHRNTAAVREQLDAWARGEVPDPCNGASFMWAGRGHSHRGEVVQCGDTANGFFTLPASRTHERYVAAIPEGLRGGDPGRTSSGDGSPHTPLRSSVGSNSVHPSDRDQ